MFSVRSKPASVLVISSVSAALSVWYYYLPSRRPDHHPLSPSQFTPTTLVDSVDVSSDTKLLTLSLPPALLPRDASVFAPIWSIFIKDTDIQVERPYTPLEGIDKNGHIKLWVKKYQRGEVGRWLHSRQVGDQIEIRGPVKTWSTLWQDAHWDHIVLISGGTGITPFYQLLHSVFKTGGTSLHTRFTLLHGSRSLTDLPPSNMLQSLATLSREYPDIFQLHLFVESMRGSPDSHSLDIQHGRIDKSVVQNALQLTHSALWWRALFGSPTHISVPPEKKILVLVCGPEGMVSAVAGPYGRNYSQGEVGGILGELGLKRHHVWKL